MDRRKFLESSISKTAAVGTAALALTSVAHASNSHSHHGHDHHGHSHGNDNRGKAAAASIKPRIHGDDAKAIAESTEKCISTGKACLAHCAAMLAKGDTSLAECNLAVSNLVAVNEALNSVAHLNSIHLNTMKDFAKACSSICKECYDTCEPHIKHHKECADCAEACLACIKTLKKIS